MADRPPLTDEELMAVADDPDVQPLLNSEERRRLSRLKPAARTWTDTAIDAIPAVGGALGGIVGGIGGTVAGFGVGGVPGAIGGATVGGAGGEGIRQAIQTWRGKEAPRGPVEALADVGTEGVIQGGWEAAGGAATKLIGAGGKAVYRGYLKPSLAKASIGKADQIVQTAINEALPVTAGGAQHGNKVIGELRAEVDGILANATGSIDLHQVAERVRAFAKKRYFKPGKSSEEFDAAMKVADSLDSHPSLGLPPGAKPTAVRVTPTQANQAKRGLDESIGESNFGVASGNATKATQKTARRMIRKELERVAPEIGPINARESRLIDAAKAISRAVGRESNKSPLIGVNTIVASMVGGADYARSGDPFAAAAKGLATRALLTPRAATRAALVATRLGKISGSVPANVARAAVIAVSETDDEAEDVPEEVAQ